MSETLSHSLEAEQSVLGCLMQDPSVLDDVEQRISAADFFEPRNGRLFAVVCRLLKSGRLASVSRIIEACAGELGPLGGEDYVSAVRDCVPSGRGAAKFADHVREKAAQRALLMAADEALTIAAAPGLFEDRLERITAMFNAMQGGRVRRAPVLLSSVMARRIDHYNDLAAGRVEPGWPTAIPTLDSMLGGGLSPGRMYVLAARPAVGKSSLAAQIAMTMARAGRPSLLLSQEMSAEEIADRAAASAGRVDLSSVMLGEAKGDDWARISDAAEAMINLPLYVDDQPALTLADIRAKARSIKGLRVLVLDYLQLSASTLQTDSRVLQIEEISRGLKALAKELGVAVVALSQLNREVEKRLDKRPNLADLRDSGAIEQDADAVLMLWPARDLPGQDRRVVGLAVTKNRQGRCGEVALDFQGAIHRWGESTAELRPAAGAAAYGGKA